VKRILPLFTSIVLLAACPPPSTTFTDDPVDDTGTIVEDATFARIQDEILVPSCAGGGCHGGDAATAAGGLSFEGEGAYAALTEDPCTHPLAVAAGLSRIEPGNAANSYLFMRITEDDPDGLGSLMPPFMSGLSPDEVALIERWIADGAPE
jgi:hypothetical protein